MKQRLTRSYGGKLRLKLEFGSTAAATGMSIITKAIIGVSAASVITVASLVLFNTEDNTKGIIAETESVNQKQDKVEDNQKIKRNSKVEISEPIQDNIYKPSGSQVASVLIDTVSNSALPSLNLEAPVVVSSCS